MNHTIRRGVFETNSSSSHSIAICNDGKLHDDDLPVVEHYKNEVDPTKGPHEHCIVLTGGEFGWGVETYNNAFMKANYLAVYLRRGTASQKAMFEKVLMEATTAKEVVYAFTDGYEGPNYSYIDHQSSDVGSTAFRSEADLKAFLFNRGSTLVIDNDNH